MEVKVIVSLGYSKILDPCFSYYPLNQNYFTVVKIEFKSYQGKEKNRKQDKDFDFFIIIILNYKTIKLN